MTQNKRRIIFYSTLLSALVAVGFLFQSEFLMSPREKAFNTDLHNLPANKLVSLSTLRSFNDYETVCIFEAYGIDPDPSKAQQDLKDIFGDIDYSTFRDGIIRSYSMFDSATGFYLVKNNKVVGAIGDDHAGGSYITGSRYASHRVGCAHTKDICLRIEAKDTMGGQPIGYGLCKDLQEASSLLMHP